jgi:hypothetical protein
MSNSVVAICNAALIDLGESAIMSLTDNCKAARLCNARWPMVRDAVLRAHPWNSCMSMTLLAAATATPAWRWAYSYPLPNDCLRVVAVADSSGGEVTRWEVQTRFLLCDADAPLAIAYVSQQTDPGQYDATLCEVFSARMAAVLAYPLTASTSLAQAKWMEYEAKLSEARGLNAREGGRAQQAQATGSWLKAKLGG